MASNDTFRESDAKQERGGGKMTTKKSNQEAPPKPYDRPLSTFGRFCAVVKDILKPSLITDAMSRLQNTQKEQENQRNVDKSGNDSDYEILCDSSEPDEVMVEVDGYQAVFQSRVLQGEMNTAVARAGRNKPVEVVTTSDQSFELQPGNRLQTRSTLESSTGRPGFPPQTSAGRSGFPPLTAAVTSVNRSSLPFHPVDSGMSRCNDTPMTPRYDAIGTKQANVLSQGFVEGETVNNGRKVSRSEFESNNGTPYRRFSSKNSSTKPAFKMSRFCESIEKIRTGTSLLSRSCAEMAALSESCGDSSFYGGRTSYGGAASAYKANPRPTSSTNPYQTRPTVQKCVQALGVGGETKVMSVTAQRILEAMQRDDENSLCSNRSMDTSICNSPLTFTPSYRRNSAQFGSTRNGPPTRNAGPPIKQLIIPSVSILKPTRATCIEPREVYHGRDQIIAGEITEEHAEARRKRAYEQPIGNSTSVRFENVKTSTIGGKAKKTPKHYVSRLDDELESTQPDPMLSSIQPFLSLNLVPGAFSIGAPATNVDKFSFSMPRESVHFAASVDNSNTVFSPSSCERPQSTFVFSPPRIIEDMSINDTSRLVPIKSLLRNDWQSKSSAVSALAPSSVHASLPLSALFKKPSDIWTCSECYVDNKTSDAVCMACTTPRPVSATQYNSTSATSCAPVTQTPVGAVSGVTLNAGGGFKFGTGSLSITGFSSGLQNFSSNNCNGGSSTSGGFKLRESFREDNGSVQRIKDQATNDELTRPLLRSDVLKSVEPKVSTCTEKSTMNVPLSELFKKPSSVWTCTECFVTNKNEVDSCMSCETTKPRTSQASKVINTAQDYVKLAENPESSAVEPLSELFKKPIDSWTCNECLVVNKSVQDTCMSCDTAKPRLHLPTSIPRNTQESTQDVTSASKPLSDLFKKPVDVWTCSECYITNKNDRTSCQSCETVKPRSSVLTSLPGTQEVFSSASKPLGELFKKPVDVWTCNECYVTNKNDRTNCQSCDTAKPRTSLLPTLSPRVTQDLSSIKSLSELFKKSVDVWTCNECYVSNKNELTSCQSCETIRPGTSVPVQLKTSAASMFTFGAQGPAASGTGTSIFGSSGASGEQFASSVFGKPFDDNNSKYSGSILASAAPASSTTFMFGSKPAQPASSLFTFGRQAPSTEITGASATSGAGLGNNRGKRSFGESSSSDTMSTKRDGVGFIFGASAPQSSGGVTFGQSQGTASVPQGFNFSSSATGFNFPSASASGVNSGGVVQFGNGEPNRISFQNPFDVTPSTNAASIANRVIKRAGRRLPKPQQ